MTYNHEHDGGTILGKIEPCPRCGLLPHLLALRFTEFDYNRLESLGCVRRGHQLVCRGCNRLTPMCGGLLEALRYWNNIDEVGDAVLTAIREGS